MEENKNAGVSPNNGKVRSRFSGKLGYVLAVAGSAVGLGNIWRFPYLAAKYGGGMFLLVYLVLMLTFGYALIVSETALGRMTRKSPVGAFGAFGKSASFRFGGWVNAVIPMLIVPYYSVIGGWVLKYFLAYLTGEGMQAAGDDYFTGFITQDVSPMVLLIIFLAVVSIVIILGVNNGIEKFSKILMPLLILLVLGIAIFSLTISHTDDQGITRTGLEGLKIYVVPDFSGLTIKGFFTVLLDAMGQLFFSLSVAMGIMVTYGSYVKDEDNLVRSINQIEIFDTVVAFLAGVMIIPAVFTFMGREGMEASGPSLMFVSLPKVFAAMGKVGNVVGCLFFAMVLFAALTSAISVMEAVVSSLMDKFHLTRLKASLIEMGIALIGGIAVCLGYNKWYFEFKLPNGAVGQILDIMDYLSNNLFMPLVAIGTCILVGWILKPKTIVDEVEKNGERFGRRGLYIVMVKYVAPILLVVLLLKSVGILTVI